MATTPATRLRNRAGANDLFVRKKGNGIARVNFTSIDGSVNYRLVGSRRTYYVKRENFVKNWTRLETKTKEHPQ